MSYQKAFADLFNDIFGIGRYEARSRKPHIRKQGRFWNCSSRGSAETLAGWIGRTPQEAYALWDAGVKARAQRQQDYANQHPS